MERDKVLNLLEENLNKDNLVKHSLAVEAAMKELADYFDEDVDKWGVCGLLHDIDYEKTEGDLETHSKVGSEMLREWGFEEEVCDAVLTHNEAHGVEPETLMAKSLYCADPLTGLIVAATLVLPSKRISDLKVENVLNRFKEEDFASSVNRENIKQCESLLGLDLEEFVGIVLRSMQKISEDLGL
ncbi:MAG TPA: HDIG domain-containing protein [Candidatus Paceibacterota bacterium]|nr:HDIG domain-containing protein [Candidatus Paceibacterota bacterium]